MKSYDYENRQGIREISWDEVLAGSQHLAELLAAESITKIVGLAKAGLFPAAMVASMLRLDLFPVRLSRRVADQVVSESPIWRVQLPEGYLKDQVVAVIDEIADTGETLAIVRQRALELGAKRVVCATLLSHSWADPKPDVTILNTDEFVIFPWDLQVFQNGIWQPHPEILSGIKAQS